jgi:hypothetical protein
MDDKLKILMMEENFSTTCGTLPTHVGVHVQQI